jgi:hypothetical protein
MATRQDRDQAAQDALGRANEAGRAGLGVLRRSRGRPLSPAAWRRYQEAEDRRGGGAGAGKGGGGPPIGAFAAVALYAATLVF